MNEEIRVAIFDNSLSARDFRRYFLRRLSVHTLLLDTWTMGLTVLGIMILTGIFSGEFHHLIKIQAAYPLLIETAVFFGFFTV